MYDDAHPTRLLKFHRETRTEGKTTAIEETVKTYRTDGRPLETRHLINGALSEGQRVSYDDLGHEMKAWHTIGGEEYLVREWRWSEDRRRSTLKTYRPLGGMSQLLKSETWTYDEEGNLLQETRHHEGGSWRSIKTFDAQERPVLLEEDSDLDGQTNYSRAWTYDEAGRELHRLTLRLNGHGKIERRDEVTSTYDDQGRPLTRIDEGPAYDIHAEAVIPTVLRHRWTYNAGETLHYIRRNDSDWLLKEREITNEAGQPLLREVFDAHIGEPARRIAHTYDAAGRRISRHTTYYGRTPHESIERWHYDARGRLVRHTFDKGDDGSLEMRTEHRY